MKFLKTLISSYYQNKGQKLLSLGKSKKALSSFNKALSYKKSPEIQFNIGLTLTALNHNFDAEQYFRKVLLNNTDNELALLALSESLSMQRKWNEANEVLQKLLQLSKKNKLYTKYVTRNNDKNVREQYVLVRELFIKSQILTQEKKFKKAKEILLNAAEINPLNVEIQNNLGSLTYSITKNPELALPYFQKALQLDSQNKKILKNISSLQRQL